MTAHLWQSTLFAAAAALLTLVFRHSPARVRHWIWLAASIKFLIPFSVLVDLGGRVQWRTAAAAPAISNAMEDFGRQLSAPVVHFQAHSASTIDWGAIGGVVWIIGSAAVLLAWCVRWRRIRAAVRLSSALRMANVRIPVRSPRALFEPGVFGIFRPMLILPEGISERLSPDQLDAIIAHELCHVRRRDNLASSIQMLVEALFWFHPLVWWIGARMVEERERACDEEVLEMGNEPEVYAESILTVCRLYLESPQVCMARITGSDLKKRVREIMTYQIAARLDVPRKMLLVGAGILAVAGPVAIGVEGASPRRAAQDESAVPRFEAASVKPHPDSATAERDRRRSIEPGRITFLDASLGEYITAAYGVKPYQISGPAWVMDRSSAYTYDVIATAGKPVPVAEVKRMLGPLLAERFHLVFHREIRELPVFALVEAKGGHKFKEPGDAGPRTLFPDREGGFSFKNWSMEDFADWLSVIPSVGRPVVDRTGIAGNFSFRANLFGLAKDTSPSDLKRAMIDSEGADALRAMLPDQMGLKLETQKAPIEILVIDHADKVPTAN